MPCSMSKLLAPLVGVALLPLATCFSCPALPGASARHVASMTPLAGRVPLRPATRPASLGLFMADETAVENAREFVAADLTVEKFWAMSIGKWKGLRSSHNIAFAQLGIVLCPGPVARDVMAAGFSSITQADIDSTKQLCIVDLTLSCVGVRPAVARPSSLPWGRRGGEFGHDHRRDRQG